MKPAFNVYDQLRRWSPQSSFATRGLFALAMCAGLCLVGPSGIRHSFAQTVQTPLLPLAERARLARLELISQLHQVDDHQSDFKGLLAVRPMAAILDGQVRALQNEATGVRDRMRQRLTMSLQEATIGGSSARVEDATSSLVRADAQVQDLDALVTDAQAHRNRINSLRRDLLSSQLFSSTLSPFSPSFWIDLVTLSVPSTIEKLNDLARLWAVHASNGFVLDTVTMATSAVMVGIIIFLFRRAMLARLDRSGLSEEASDNRKIMIRGMVILLISVGPIPCGLAFLAMLDRQIDFAPALLDPFFEVAVLVTSGILTGSAVLKTFLQPKRPQLRLVRMSTSNAILFYQCGLALMLIYGAAIACAELESALHFLVAISAATAMIWVLSCCGCIAATLIIMERRRSLALVSTVDLAADQGAPHACALEGVALPVIFVWFSILAWTVVGLCTASVFLGYLALAGFIMGRFIVTLLFFILTAVLWIAIDVLLTPSTIAPPFEMAAANTEAVRRRDALALLTVVTSGILRAALIVVMIFVAVGPWHLEYGEVNPFRDAFLGISLYEIRNIVGVVTFSFAIFLIGIFVTKILTSWLHFSVLPQTRLEIGLRYSLTTIVSYSGIVIALVVSLSQIGVSPQSLTFVASALSVGIGFGLRGIVANLLSGLIVLAERPIRVGDLIVVKGEEGRVEKISVRSTLVSTSDGVDLIVPNVDLITSIVRNKTLTGPNIGLRMKLIVRHNTDLGIMFDEVTRIVDAHPNVMSIPAPKILMVKPTEIGLEFEVRCMLIDGVSILATRSEINIQWIDAFRRNGIRFPDGGAVFQYKPEDASCRKTDLSSRVDLAAG